MDIGTMRHRITIQKPVIPDQRDAIGGVVEDWVDVCEVWAEVLPIAGREFFAADRVTSELDTRVKLRYRSDIEPHMRVIWRTRAFDIEAVLNLQGGDIAMHLMCKEVV